MSFNRKSMQIITIAILAIILNLVYNSYSTSLSIAILCVFYILTIIFNKQQVLLFPFFTYPFMFLMRNQDPTNVILIVLPDISAGLAILIYLIQKRFSVTKKGYPLLLLSYAVITTFIAMIHIEQLHYFPVVFRQYTLPVLFLIIFIDASYKYSDLPRDALRISIISFALVGILSLMNIFGILTVNASTEALYPYLNYYENKNVEDNIDALGRGISLFNFPRLNLFTGGSLGSSASIFLTISLVSFLKNKNELGGGYKILSLPLFVVSILTFSVSIISPLIIFMFISFSKIKSKVTFYYIMAIIIFIFFNINLFQEKSALEYVLETSYSGLVSYFSDISFLSVIIGSGPSIRSAGYAFEPKLFITDIGIIRIFSETGVVSFCLYFFFLLLVLKRAISIIFDSVRQGGVEYCYIFIVFLLLVHGNITAQPPFFPLFAACVAGILNQSKECLQKSS